MSYEGRKQSLCKNGHLTERMEEYSFEYKPMACTICLEELIFVNSVDDTNGDAFGYIDFTPFLLKAEVRQTCNLGHEHIIEHAVYRIPTANEKIMHQTYTHTHLHNGEVKRYQAYPNG